MYYARRSLLGSPAYYAEADGCRISLGLEITSASDAARIFERSLRNMLKVFIGYDAREVTAYHVLSQSLITHASQPIEIVPLVQHQLRWAGQYWRGKDVLASTEFSLTRFLVPHLSKFSGVSVFLDCDMLCQRDIIELATHAVDQPEVPVFVVQHDYTPKTAEKMDGVKQTVYPRKNWSSVMVFNNAHCSMLTPQYVNTAQPSELHRLAWASSVGALPKEWNWLVGEYESNPKAYLLHYTLGGPWFKRNDGEASSRWITAYRTITLGGAFDGCLST
jgi:hypothetical protein